MEKSFPLKRQVGALPKPDDIALLLKHMCMGWRYESLVDRQLVSGGMSVENGQSLITVSEVLVECVTAASTAVLETRLQVFGTTLSV